MKTNALPLPDNVVTWPSPRRLGRIPNRPAVPRLRFRILPFRNASGTRSYRVQGMNRDGKYLRQNYADLKVAQMKQAELEAEFHNRRPEDAALRLTKLNEAQLRLAETVFFKLDEDEDVVIAVDYWKRHGRQRSPQARAPRLDDALLQFNEWATQTPTLRQRTKKSLRLRLNLFARTVGNPPVDSLTVEALENYLAGRKVAPHTKRGDKLALSRFLSWCVERPRHWLAYNPAREIRLEMGAFKVPAVLTLAECKRLLKVAESHREGRLLPYTAVCLFAGLRPTEAARLTWQNVNLKDRELRLEGSQTKTGRPRVMTICNTLVAWLQACEGKPFWPASAVNDWKMVRRKAGFQKWCQDVLRHTAISHYFRKTGSYGETAEQFGNSEGIIKKHYQGRVASADTKKFYALRPPAGGLGVHKH